MLGMRERVDLDAGDLESGQLEGGGYAIRVTLPLMASQR